MNVFDASADQQHQRKWFNTDAKKIKLKVWLCPFCILCVGVAEGVAVCQGADGSSENNSAVWTEMRDVLQGLIEHSDDEDGREVSDEWRRMHEELQGLIKDSDDEDSDHSSAGDETGVPLVDGDGAGEELQPSGLVGDDGAPVIDRGLSVELTELDDRMMSLMRYSADQDPHQNSLGGENGGALVHHGGDDEGSQELPRWGDFDGAEDDGAVGDRQREQLIV